MKSLLKKSPRASHVQGKVDDTAVQETLMSAGEHKRAVGLKEEVEPPEDMDVSDVDVDPSMLIWKAVQESRRRGVEETRARGHAHHAHHAHANGPRQPVEAQLPRAPAPGSRYQQAEPDMDEVFHNFPNRAGAAEQQEAQEEEQRAETSRGRYEQAELDLDHVYHGDKGQVQVQRQTEVGQDDVSMPGHRGRSLPEEDMDDLYHKY